MRLGVHINRFNHPGGGPAPGFELAAAGVAAEAAGVHRLTVMDHCSPSISSPRTPPRSASARS